jgi:hypothetical protein
MNKFKKAVLYANHLKNIQGICKLPLDVCNIIIKYIVDKQTINKHFKVASYFDQLEIIKCLHKHGADIIVDHNCAIRRAIKKGNLEIVQYLYENGAWITKYQCRKMNYLGDETYSDYIYHFTYKESCMKRRHNCLLNKKKIETIQYLYANGVKIKLSNGSYNIPKWTDDENIRCSIANTVSYYREKTSFLSNLLYNF